MTEKGWILCQKIEFWAQKEGVGGTPSFWARGHANKWAPKSHFFRILGMAFYPCLMTYQTILKF